ncbi:MAG: PAS domain S-box protein [Chitinophagales bacterium]
MKKQEEAIDYFRSHTSPENIFLSIILELEKGVFFLDGNGKLLIANEQAAEAFNTTTESLYQSKDISELWKAGWTVTTEKGDPLPVEKAPFYKALRTGVEQSSTLVVKPIKGGDRWLQMKSKPLFDSRQLLPFSVVSSIEDVTDERMQKNKCKSWESMFREFSAQTQNLIWMVDEDEHLVFANTAYLKYFGLSKSDLNKKIVDLIPAEVARALYEDHIKVLETGKPKSKEQRVRWADGTNLVFRVNIFPIEGWTGKKMLGGHAIPITDNQSTEKQLREANEKLLNMNRAVVNAIWEWDMRTGQIFRNEPLMDMIGYPIENTKGLAWWLHRIHPEDRNRVNEKVRQTAESKQMSWEHSYRFKCADGSYKHIRDRGFVVYENDLPVKMIGSLQDVTDVKELEDRLTKEKIQRQKEISETVIQVQEKERARIGNELHDNVNQLLTASKLFVEMLTPDTAEERVAKDKGMEYIATAIEEIRKLSKELVVPHLKEKGLVDSIQILINDLQITKLMKISFAHDSDVDLMSPGRKLTLFRIVQEQLKNILKYSKATITDISLNLQNEEVQLTIRDNGIGFDPKKTFRGVGLSSIHERTRFYNGTVDIQTNPGKGCTLEVNIPSI